MVSDSTLPNTESKGKVEESVSTDTSFEGEEVDYSGEKLKGSNDILEEEDIEEEIDGEEEEEVDTDDDDDDDDTSSTDIDDDAFSDEDNEVLYDTNVLRIVMVAGLLQVHHGWGELDKDVPVSLDTSCRLAVCNMDWDHVSAQDLFGECLLLVTLHVNNTCTSVILLILGACHGGLQYLLRVSFCLMSLWKCCCKIEHTQSGHYYAEGQSHGIR